MRCCRHGVGCCTNTRIPGRYEHGTVNTLWWLTYRHGAAAAGIALIATPSLIHARMRAMLDGIDEGIEFDEGHALDAQSSRLIMPSERGHLLTGASARRLTARIDGRKHREQISRFSCQLRLRSTRHPGSAEKSPAESTGGQCLAGTAGEGLDFISVAVSRMGRSPPKVRVLPAGRAGHSKRRLRGHPENATLPPHASPEAI
jgi:hypothetical protein